MKRMILLLVLLLAAGCKANAPKESVGEHLKKPPALTVRAGKAEGSATLGTYSWEWPNADGTCTGVEADGMHPLDMLDHMTPLSVGGERRLTLRFELGSLTLDKLTVRRWDMACVGDPNRYESDFEMLSFTVEGDTVTVDLPNDRGGIFEVHAYFTGESHGDGYYAFCLHGATERAVDFTWKRIRIAWRESLSELPRVRIIRSRAALQDALSAETAQDGPMPDRDESFFTDQELFLIHLEEGSGSISHEVTEVLTGPTGVTVTVHRIVPEVCTADMAAWIMLVDLPAGTASETVPVTVKII